ncbi:MAG: polysaccharide deacetylase family protein [Candidatus Omnitrophica bacterium]|nr:polysaccharide deacetylase family protein [Candidatus Omnitrophota bacterium]
MRKGIFIISLCLLIFIVWAYPRYSIPVLLYHSISYNDNLLSVKPENFKKQMAYLNKHNFKVITLEELVEGMKERNKFPRKTVAITFDDGYKDNFTYAYPVLKEYAFPAIIFLITGKTGNDKEYLNWDEVREMVKSGIIDFGGHTRSHTYLPSLQNNQAKLWEEIYGCKEDIEKSLGITVKFFAYPVGGFSEKIKELVKKAGYKAGLTTNRGKDLRNLKDIYEINRISVRNDNLFVFKIKVSGYYNLFRKGKNPY